MTIGDLKGWLKPIPQEMDDMPIIYRRYEEAQPENIKEGADYFYAIDVPLVSGLIDGEGRECCLIDEKTRSFIISMNKKLNSDSEKKQ